MHQIRPILFAIAALFAAAATGAELRFAWNPSLTPDLRYAFYASTNELTSATRTTALRVDVGTNTAAVVSVPSGVWRFAVAAYSTNQWTIEGDLSPIIRADVPEPPQGLRLIIIEHKTLLSSTNWQDVGFFRLKIQ